MMATAIKLNGRSRRLISVPLALEQVAFSLQQLTKKDLEVLEELLDVSFQRKMLSRGRTALALLKRGRTIPLRKLQQEFKR